ncbi:autophagy-related protein 9A [Centruroides vittatus]|uniref:autophagy-related protein 9A n=1 Tax=Centruroides vittatus TaxID=120091 RepID=UPI0035106315
MTTLQTGYQALLAYNDNEAETPQDSGVMIHVVPESGKSRWNHIEDLDSFFTRVYLYHQKNGFGSMVLDEILMLIQFIFAVIFTIFITSCVNYPVLFKDIPPQGVNHTEKVTLRDVVIPLNVCVYRLHPLIVFCLIVASVFLVLRLIKVVYQLFQYNEIKVFYSTALKIAPDDLENMTWHEVQCRLLEVQCEQQMCIHKRELSELDIYHRILRFKNYMVAMVNKNILPIKFNLPFIGEIVFFSKGLKYNLEMILFWGPWAPFENSWHLKEDYKKVSKRNQMAKDLSTRITWIGIANGLLSPLILVWHLLMFFYSYVEQIKREPSVLGTRTWSNYARFYLRHFNELEHEFDSRLSRAYKPSTSYISLFTSHKAAAIARCIIFMAGAVFSYFLVLTIYDEDVMTVEHILFVMTFCGIICAGCQSFLPPENLVWCPEKLMTNILAHIHYIPDHWRGKAHIFKVRNEFSQLFQLKVVHFLEELISPIVTPIILCFYLPRRSLDIVDFLRNFTVEVVGVGDVCSFAQMDVRRHGNPNWMTEGHTEANQYQQAEDGKTELSLMHFTLTNPNWIPPEESSVYLNNLRDQAVRDVRKLHMMPEENALYYSLNSVSSLGGEYSDLVKSILHTNVDPSIGPTSILARSLARSQLLSPSAPSPVPVFVGNIAQREGPLHINSAGLISSLHHSQYQHQSESHITSIQPSSVTDVPLEFTAANMSISTLYMHGLHSKYLKQRSSAPRVGHPSIIWQRPLQDMPGIMESPQEVIGIEGEERAEHQPLLPDTRITRSS